MYLRQIEIKSQNTLQYLNITFRKGYATYDALLLHSQQSKVTSAKSSQTVGNETSLIVVLFLLQEWFVI